MSASNECKPESQNRSSITATPLPFYLIRIALAAALAYVLGEENGKQTLAGSTKAPERFDKDPLPATASSWQDDAGPLLPPAKSQTKVALSGPATAAGIVLGEHTIADIARQAGKFVVHLEVTGAPPNMIGIQNWSNAEKRLWQLRQNARAAVGAGVIIHSDGLILTSDHVAERGLKIKAVLSDRRAFNARVVGRDRRTDLAVLKIDGKGLPVAELSGNDACAVGDWVVAIGSPLRLDHTVSLGIVSGVGRSISPLGAVELVQTDAAINPGNSGGPLVNLHGQVIGILCTQSNIAQGISFAVPVKSARQAIHRILAEGGDKQAYLGLAGCDLDVALDSEALGTWPLTGGGVMVFGVEPGSPAELAGLAAGDIICSMNGQPVFNYRTMHKQLASLHAGDVIKLSIMRAKLLRQCQVTLSSGN